MVSNSRNVDYLRKIDNAVSNVEVTSIAAEMATCLMGW